MKIYILRHERRHGKPNFDTDLTEIGHENANNLANLLESLEINEIYCSPFKRIIQTIEPFLKKTGKKVNIEYSLYEYIHSSDFSQDDVRIVNEEMYGYNYFNIEYKSFYSCNNIIFPESKINLEKRVLNFVNSVKSNEEKNILLISHMSPINILTKDYLNSNYPQGGLSLIYDNEVLYKSINF